VAVLGAGVGLEGHVLVRVFDHGTRAGVSYRPMLHSVSNAETPQIQETEY